MSDKFIELTKQVEAKIAELKELSGQLEVEARTIGVGTYMQDHFTGAVYKIVRPKGRFVTFPEIGYVRTRIKDLGEKTGDLSLTEAREAGYTVE